MTKSYDLGDWDRLEYVQEAHLECGAALQTIRDLRKLPTLSDHERIIHQRLGPAEQALESLLERLALRVSDLMDDDEGKVEWGKVRGTEKH